MVGVCSAQEKVRPTFPTITNLELVGRKNPAKTLGANWGLRMVEKPKHNPLGIRTRNQPTPPTSKTGQIPNPTKRFPPDREDSAPCPAVR